VAWPAFLQLSFDHIIGYDRSLLGYNLLFLLFVGLLPFSTAAVGLVGFNKTIYPFYWAIYCANIILAGVLLTLTWVYAVTHGQVDAAVTPLQSRHIITRQLVTPAVFVISVIAEYLYPRAYLGPNTLLLLPVVRWLVDQSYAKADPELQIRRGWTEFLWRVGSTIIWLLIIGLAVWASAL
jgi:uncharacterized membrane protein